MEERRNSDSCKFDHEHWKEDIDLLILKLMARSIGLGKGSTNKPLSIGKDGFKQIMSGYGFPKVFADTVQSNNGSYACFVDHEKVDDQVSSTFLCGYFFSTSAI